MWNKPQLLNAIADLLVLVATAALVAGVAVWLARVPAMPVQQVVFTEALAHTRRAEVEQVLPQALKGNFFSLNLEQVRAMLETLPWVRRAEVRRIWPSRLEVAVEEHVPAARWGEGKGELVNTHGEVFLAAPVEVDLASLPTLNGPAGTAPEVLGRYAAFSEALAPLGEKPVMVSLSPRLAWQMRLENGLLLDMGREQSKSPIGVRLQRFVEFYPEAVGKRQLRPTVVDLRYPNGFAMRVAAESKGK
ncbi:cell division protein FtsQ/DivIB [Dechloromonas sp. ZY10]|uniref:cell division protein FtsQ/DivIB n=1 Tax=Dechloromonas aquae TaxID=2664436 RepID=UPI00352843FD